MFDVGAEFVLQLLCSGAVLPDKVPLICGVYSVLCQDGRGGKVQDKVSLAESAQQVKDDLHLSHGSPCDRGVLHSLSTVPR